MRLRRVRIDCRSSSLTTTIADRGSQGPGDASSLVSLHLSETIAEISLDSGPLNLVDNALLRSLNSTLGEVASAGVRCLILHGGKAKAFCAGSDIKEFDHLRENASEQKILFEDMDRAFWIHSGSVEGPHHRPGAGPR